MAQKNRMKQWWTSIMPKTKRVLLTKAQALQKVAAAQMKGDKAVENLYRGAERLLDVAEK